MAEMNARMRLTLENLASGPLQAFADQLRGLEDLAKSLNGTLAPLPRLLSRIGASADGGSAGLGRLTQALTALAERMEGLEAKLGANREAFGQLGLMARSTASDVKLASDAIGATAGKLDAASASAARAKSEMTGMASAMRGMAEIWAGFKIDRGLERTVSSASGYQQTLLRMQVRNLPPGEQAALVAEAKRQARRNPLMSVNEALQGELAAIPGLPGNSAYSQNMRRQLFPLAAQAAIAAKYIGGDRSSFSHRMQNVYGIVDAMGGASNIDRARAVINALTQAMNGGGGKLGLQSVETYLRMRNRAATTTMGTNEFLKEMATLEEFKAAGGGGAGGNTRGATLYNAIQQLSYGGVMAKAGANLLAQMGLINTKAITPYGHSSTQAVLAPGALLDSAMAQNSTVDWVQKIMIPRMLAYTRQNWKTFGYHSGSAKDLNNAEEAANAISILAGYLSKMRVGGQTLGSGLSMLGNPASVAAINANAQQMHAAMNGKQTSAAVQSTYAGTMDQFHKSLDNLARALGVTVIPALTRFVQWLNRGVGWLAGFFQNHRLIGLFTELAASVSGALLVLAGFGRFLGFDKPVLNAFKNIVKGGGWLVDSMKFVASKIGSAFEVAVAALEDFAPWVLRLAALFSDLVVPVTGLLALFHSRSLDQGEQAQLAARRSLLGPKDWGIKGGWGNSTAQSPEQTTFAGMLAALKTFTIPGGNPLALGGIAGTHYNPAADAQAQRYILTQDLLKRAEARLRAQFGNHDIGVNAYYDSLLHDQSQGLQNEIAVLQRKRAAYARAGDKHGIATTDTQITLRQRDLADLEANNSLERQHALASLRKVDAGTMRQYLQLRGPYDLSQGIQAIRDKHAAQRKLLTLNGDTSGLHALDLLQNQEIANFRVKSAKHQLSDLQGNLHNQQQTNAALVTAGVLTKDQAQQKTLAEQRAAAPGLLQAAQQVEALARAAGDTGLAGRMAALIPQFQALGNGLTQFQQKIAGVMQGAFANFFSGVMKGQETWRQLGHNFVANILNGMNKTMSQDLATGLVNALTGSNTSTGQALRGVGSSGGFIGSMVQSMFGTKGAGASGAAASSATSSGGIFASIGGWLATHGWSFANGIDYVPHDMVAQIHQGEMIVPAAGAAALRAGAMGGHQIHLSIHAMDSQSVLGAMDGVKRELAQMLGGANQNLNLGAY